jgi:hypothetical protein
LVEPDSEAAAPGQNQPRDRSTRAWLVCVTAGNAEPAQATDAKARQSSSQRETGVADEGNREERRNDVIEFVAKGSPSTGHLGKREVAN